MQKTRGAHEEIKIETSKNSLERNNIIKELKKLDSELVKKNEGIFNNPKLKNVFKPLLNAL